MQRIGLVTLLTLALMLAGSAFAQSTQQRQQKSKLAAFDPERVYLEALGDERKPGPVDPGALTAARAWIDQLDIILLVDQEILGSARSTAEVFYSKNKDKHKNVRNFSEHEIIPYLFKNSEKFRDVFAVAIADTMNANEIRQLASAGKLAPQDPLAPKTQEAGQKFDKVATFLAAALTTQMIESANFSSYGLDLSIATTPSQ